MTFIKASLKLAMNKNAVTKAADVPWAKNNAIRLENYKIPMIIIYDFRLVPNMGTLSLKSPYNNLSVQGICITLRHTDI